MELISENITMRANVEIVSGNVVFPFNQQLSNEIELSKIVPSGDENSCFVFRDKANRVIGRIGIRSDTYPMEIRYNAEVSSTYTEEIFTVWIDWLFGNTNTQEICDLIVGNSPEKEFVKRKFQARESQGDYGMWYFLTKGNWA